MITTRSIHSGAVRTVTAIGGTFGIDQQGHAGMLGIVVAATAVSGTSPTLDVVLQWSPDAGTTWVTDPEFTAAAPQLTAPGGICVAVPVKSTSYRVNLVIGGTTPSFTMSQVLATIY